MTKQFEGYWEDLDIPEDWECESYHNDAAPSWISGVCQIFVDHPDESKREVKGDHRFFIFSNFDYGDPVILFDSGNDWNTIINLVKEINLQEEEED
tara:strand:+ start:301 stop:588 length:288 start_codon:yes stop_codon:yes gene_type:complete